MTDVRPEFIVLPADGERCPYTGMKRGSMRNLCMPTEANGQRPPVPAKVKRQRGKLRGIILIPYEPLMAYLHGLPDSDAESEQLGTATTGPMVEAGQPAGAARSRRTGRTASAKGRA